MLARLVAEAASYVPGAESAQAILDLMDRCDISRRKFIRLHHHIVCEYFSLRLEQYLSSVLAEAWDIHDWFFRLEHAKERGTIHAHGLC